MATEIIKGDPDGRHLVLTGSSDGVRIVVKIGEQVMAETTVIATNDLSQPDALTFFKNEVKTRAMELWQDVSQAEQRRTRIEEALDALENEVSV